MLCLLEMFYITVGCQMEHDCMWEDKTYIGDDRASKTISKHNETKTP